MKQDIEQQMGRTPSLIEKYLTQIDNALYSFRDKKKMSESVEIVKDLLEQTGEMLGNVMEVRTVVALFNQWKQMQTEFAVEHVTGANSYGVTSGISQLVTQMMVLRDLLNLKASVDTMFEEADRSLKMMIQEPEVEVKAPVREKKKTVYEITGRAPKQADPPVRRTPRVIGESPIRKSSPGVQRKVGAQQNGASPRISQKSNNTTKRDVKDPVRVSQKGNGEKEAKAPARRPQKTIGDAPAVKRSNDVDAPVRASQKRKDDVVVDDPPVPNYEEGVDVSDGEEENAKDVPNFSDAKDSDVEVADHEGIADVQDESDGINAEEEPQREPENVVRDVPPPRVQRGVDKVVRKQKVAAPPPKRQSPRYEAVEEVNDSNLRDQLVQEMEVRKEKQRQLAAIEDTGSEIETLQKELELLTEQSTRLTRELEQHQNQSVEDPIVPLRMQKRELEEEMIRLEAAIQRMVSQIEDPEVAEVYKENSELRQQRADMNRQLLSLRERCLRMNSVAQKAALASHAPDLNADSIYEEYRKAFEENEKLAARRNALAIDVENLERKRDSLLFEKYFTEEAGSSIIEDLLKMKSSYKTKKEDHLRRQQKMQSDAALILRRKTETAIAKLHQKATELLKEPLQRKQALTQQYDELKDAYNDAVTRGDEIVYEEGDNVVTVDDAQATLTDLSQLYAKVMDEIKAINKEEIEGEKEIIQGEISQLDKGNEELVKWISQVQQNSVDTQAEIQCLTIQYQLLEKAMKDPQFDIEQAFDEALEKTHQGNEKLKTMLQLVMDELTGLDTDLGGSAEPMSLEDRIVSISEKVKSMRTT